MLKVKVKFVAWFAIVVSCCLWVAYYTGLTSYKSTKKCPISGPFSSAPVNLLQFDSDVANTVEYLKSLNIDTVVWTSINEEAALYNFPPFLKSVKEVSPAFQDRLIFFCLDQPSLEVCQVNHNSKLCILMDLGVSGDSLAPGGNDKSNRDYWKLTYGRVYASIALHKHNINILAVDVDAVFLQNPFNPQNGLIENPNGIRVVSDIGPFTFKYGSKIPINGGFLYYPGVNPVARQFSTEILDKIWEKNCEPQKNEQLVTSSVLRYMTRKYKNNAAYDARMLSASQYLNFCSTDCGTGLEFSSAVKLEDLHSLDNKWNGNEKYTCDSKARESWVYFHAACLNKEHQTKQNVAKAKGMIQSAVNEWVKET